MASFKLRGFKLGEISTGWTFQQEVIPSFFDEAESLSTIAPAPEHVAFKDRGVAYRLGRKGKAITAKIAAVFFNYWGKALGALANHDFSTSCNSA